jgi:glutamyl/glutaminyl-tRNA synthetase
VSECRKSGYPPEAVVNAIALLGWSPPGDRVVFSLDELRAEFDLARASRSPGIFDPAKLDWISGQHIHAMAEERVAREVAPYLVAAGLLPDGAPGRDAAWMRDLGALLRGAIERFDQAPERAAGLFFAGGWPADAQAREALASPAARAVVESLERQAKEAVPVDRERWKAVVDAVKAESGAKGKALFLPIRAVVTGSVAGPELDHLVPLAARGATIFADCIAPIDRRAAQALAEWP